MKILVALLAFACVLGAADLTGKWTGTIEFEGRNGPEPALLVLKHTGDELTGTAGPDEGRQMPIEKGKVNGDVVTFAITTEGTINVELKLVGERLQGSLSGAKPDGETMKAKLDVGRKKD